ncbi:hypothetical protein [Phenylobacterium sp.]|uniref:hypothetical protein n=1 Tax=Phenylobacterium sp. TaxID=1871053 RepID=UPI002CB85440|nr:hypothetical protein [Phenylobacterium sp.]HLZ75810.1 hypothetical protein [Phenylobacterium sp.]
MKSLFVVALAASALTSAAPAMAQQFQPSAGGPVQPGHGFREQLEMLEGRVREGIRAGQIDPGEAARANRELASIRGEMENLRSRSGGELSDMDRGRLQQRLDGLSRSIHWMRQNGPVAGPGGPPPVVAMPQGQMAGGEWSLERREAWMQERLDRARSDGSLTRHDIKRAQNTLNGILARQNRMMRDGHLDGRERSELEGRLDQLRDTLRWANREDAPPWRR